MDGPVILKSGMENTDVKPRRFCRIRDARALFRIDLRLGMQESDSGPD
jgi:hypothetical protein